jgi:hypothetical protein
MILVVGTVTTTTLMIRESARWARPEADFSPLDCIVLYCFVRGKGICLMQLGQLLLSSSVAVGWLCCQV